MSSESETLFPIEWAIPFVDAAIPKLEELGLQFYKAQWSDDICEASRVLFINIHDTIAKEDVRIFIPHSQIINWAVAKTDRAAEYLLDLTIGDAIFTGTIVGSTGFCSKIPSGGHTFYDQDWEGLTYGTEYEDFHYSF